MLKKEYFSIYQENIFADARCIIFLYVLSFFCIIQQEMTDTSTDIDAATSNDGSDNTTTNVIIWTTANAPSSKKRDPVAVVRAAVDDSLAERSTN